MRIFSNLHNLFSTEVIYVPDEVIFNMLGIFDPELKAKRKEEHFPTDLKDAYDLGVKIAQDSLKI